MTAEKDARKAERIGVALDVAALCALCEYLGSIDEDTTYQDAYEHMAGVEAAVASYIADAYGLFNESKMAYDVAWEAEQWAKPYREYKGMNGLPVASEHAQHVRDAQKRLDAEAHGIFDTRVVKLITPDGRVLPFAEAYQEMVTGTIAEINAGGMSTIDAIQRTITHLGMTGLQVQYKSGITRDLYSALYMNVYDGYSQVMRDIQTTQAAAFGADGVEVSAHALCAEDHLPYQGHQYTNAEWESVQSSLNDL